VHRSELNELALPTNKNLISELCIALNWRKLYRYN